MSAQALTQENVAERRSGRRWGVIEKGTIVLRDLGATIDCIVLNLSEEGAKIRLPDDTFLPAIFELRVGYGRPRCSKLRWRHGNDAGAQFLLADTGSDAQANNSADIQRRSWRREPCIRRGVIVFNNASCTMDCVVLDLSKGGAKLRPLDLNSCPKYFQLRISYGPTHDCEVVRSEGQKLAVRFLDVDDPRRDDPNLP